ncbi:hypothetical protein IWQ60_005999 [Tieghemiomyces parasiticus]|uniref:Uncharacterized protein n=1 Tax=Tieghemiomyces parasiticus TaxID=78921 RepID=A0A9W8DSK5_9FUNG|nr:hypothetical protein IWQ60_005999 [Tieghemiomyces parasiticus]
MACITPAVNVDRLTLKGSAGNRFATVEVDGLEMRPHKRCRRSRPGVTFHPTVAVVPIDWTVQKGGEIRHCPLRPEPPSPAPFPRLQADKELPTLPTETTLVTRPISKSRPAYPSFPPPCSEVRGRPRSGRTDTLAPPMPASKTLSRSRSAPELAAKDDWETMLFQALRTHRTCIRTETHEHHIHRVVEPPVTRPGRRSLSPPASKPAVRSVRRIVSNPELLRTYPYALQHPL